MKNKLLKVLAVGVLAASMVSLSAAPMYAANTVYTNGQWTATSDTAANTKQTITIIPNEADEDKDLTVIAYQIVKGTYKDGKLTGYVLVDSTKAALEDIEAPTSTEVTTIANNIEDNATTLSGIKLTKGNDGKYTADVEAGEYIVLVKGSDTTVYNPAVVAVNINDANDVSDGLGGEVDMATKFEAGDTAYLKSSTTDFNKDIVASSVNNTEGDTVAFDSDVKFVLNKMTIPSYSKEYKNLMYEISDTLEGDAFLGVKDLIVKVGNATVAADSTTYTLTYKDKNGNVVTDAAKANSFVISFADQYIRDNENKSVEVTYTSHFTDNAGINYNENTNRASLKYSNDPTDSTKYKELDDTTYHYTFGIDASIDGEAGSDDEETHELNKVTKAEDSYEDSTGVTTSVKTQKSKSALKGAEFTLYSDSGFTSSIAAATSDDNGHISFTGLDEGTYYLKETKAPSGYTLNETNYKIVIKANLDEEGVMTSYSITTTNADTGAAVGSATYTNEATVNADGTVTNNITKVVTPAEIVDTKLAELPSTGGSGTVVLTIVAAAGMAMFLVVFIANKRKKNDQ